MSPLPKITINAFVPENLVAYVKYGKDGRKMWFLEHTPTGDVKLVKKSHAVKCMIEGVEFGGVRA